jgi:hydroxymethylpyrimidine/phosphomethylpyrimidine kinase
VKIALSIAGSDSGGGAGIQADLKTFHQLGVFGTSVVTAVTAQNTEGVLDWDPVRPGLVATQLDAVLDDLPPDAVKTGMLASGATVRIVAEMLARRPVPFYVLDPVMVATSGDKLVDDDAIGLITRKLVPLATLVTPNLREAGILTGGRIDSPADMLEAGRFLVGAGAGAALIKGGHLAGERLVDLLVTAGGVEEFTHARQATTSTHGTGCALSAAIAAGLARGDSLGTAVRRGVAFVQRAIATAPGLGRGHGPLGFFAAADET